MQRTVKSVKITYAHNELDNENKLVTELRTHTVFNETDEKKAIKKAIKELGYIQPIKIESVEDLYILDDEIFFKYATIKKPETETDKKPETETK